jgi:hypothetical protein
LTAWSVYGVKGHTLFLLIVNVPCGVLVIML